MENNQYLFMNVSILYRCAQKFFDKQLIPYEIGAGQLQFLIQVYENEGITMQALASLGMYDKGTITKSIQKLEDLGYVKMMTHVNDKRVRCLYTTDKTKEIISNIYLIRRQWWEKVTKGMNKEEAEIFEHLLDMVAKNATKYMEDEEKEMRFFGMQKLTLLDYPGKMACTLFTGGCNFRCPFCQNSDLVFLPENRAEIKEEDVLSYLKKRQGVLEGVCISGGEPLLHEELEGFLRQVKSLGYQVKIDTNGCFLERLKELIDLGLVDYVAMDIKNCKEAYGDTVGMKMIDIEKIEECVDYLKSANIDYEFRTTLVKEFHNEERMKKIASWIQGAKHYYLQNFVDGPSVIQQGLHGFDKEELEHFKKIVEPYVEHVEIRGI